MKVSEEIGESISAYIGANRFNERKGHYATERDVAKELCDIVITAMVALNDWTEHPEWFFNQHLRGIQERVSRDGS